MWRVLKLSIADSITFDMASHGRESTSHKKDDTDRSSGGQFVTTRWSMVLAATHQAPGGSSRRAMEELIKSYWMPLYVFIRRHGNNPHQAEDLTQGFFAHLLANSGLMSVDRDKGKFRSFLLSSLKNYVADQHDKATAFKRGGNRPILSLDAMEAESHYSKVLADTMTPERLFERSWAISLLNQVLLRLEQEYARRGKQAAFEALRHSLDGQSSDMAHAQVAGQLGISEGAVRVMVHRLRQRYRQLLRDQIMLTLDDDQQVDDEIRYLLQCL